MCFRYTNAAGCSPFYTAAGAFLTVTHSRASQPGAPELINSGERLRLHGRTLFLRKKRYTMLLRAMPKRAAWGWDSGLNRNDGVIKPQSAPAPIVYRANARMLADI